MSTINSGRNQSPQYEVVTDIKAPIEACFAAASAEAAMAHWVPGFSAVEYNHDQAEEPYEAGSYRNVTIKPGISVREEVTATDAPVFFAYRIPSLGPIGDLFIKQYCGEMRFKALDSGTTRLTWCGYFEGATLPFVTTPLMRAAMRKFIGAMSNNLRRYLEQGY